MQEQQDFITEIPEFTIIGTPVKGHRNIFPIAAKLDWSICPEYRENGIKDLGFYARSVSLEYDADVEWQDEVERQRREEVVLVEDWTKIKKLETGSWSLVPKEIILDFSDKEIIVIF